MTCWHTTSRSELWQMSDLGFKPRIGGWSDLHRFALCMCMCLCRVCRRCPMIMGSQVRLAGYKVLLEVAIKASLVPDYIGAVAKDLVKVEDDAVRRMGLRVASRAALIDVKKVCCI